MLKRKFVYLMFLWSVAVIVCSGMAKSEKTSVCGKTCSVEIIGHRGSSFTAPENTKAALMLAWKQGAPYAECDVYLTKDNKIMLMHDKSAKRTGGVDVNMAETDSKTLRKLDVGSWKDPNHYKGEKIPFLEEVIKAIPKGKKLVIEVKSGVEILPYLEQVIKKSGKTEQLVIIAFDFKVITGCKRLMPDIPAYWLIATKTDKETKQPIPHSLDNIKKVKLKGLDGIDAHYAGVTKEFADGIHAQGMKLYIWTVDEPEEAKKQKDMGVDGITTNKPDLMLKIFSR